MRFTLLGSGSAGNALLLVSARTKILVDCGLSYRQLVLRAGDAGELLDDLDAVFVTHEHGDHVRGLRTLTRNHPVPVYMTHGTAAGLSPGMGRISGIVPFEAGDSIEVGDLRLDSFSVTHDAADPVSYVVRNGAANLGIATDLGKVNDLVRQRLTGCTALVLESNYCPNMLRNSSYPESIRQRIRSTHGHLSNHDSNSLLASVLHDALRLVVLVHISRENNTAELAQSLAAQVLRGHTAQLVVAAQDKATPVFQLTEPAQQWQNVM